MSTKSATPAEPKEKKTREPRRKYPFMLAVRNILGADEKNGEIIFSILPEITGSAAEPIPNSFTTRDAAIKAAATIMQFCTEHEVHIITVSPRITVTPKTRIVVKLGE